MTNRKIEYWVIPPSADAEFVADMEAVLDTYAKPYDPACPVLCMDESGEVLRSRARRPGEKDHARRVVTSTARGDGQHRHVHERWRAGEGGRASDRTKPMGGGDGRTAGGPYARASGDRGVEITRTRRGVLRVFTGACATVGPAVS